MPDESMTATLTPDEPIVTLLTNDVMNLMTFNHCAAAISMSYEMSIKKARSNEPPVQTATIIFYIKRSLAE